MDQQNDIDALRQKVQELERQIQEIKLQIQPRKRQTNKMKLQDKAIKRRIYNKLHQGGHKRERQIDKKHEKALHQIQPKDSATQEAQEQTKMLKQQTKMLKQQTQEIKRMLLEPTTLDEYIKEWHASTFSKLTIHLDGPQRDPSTAEILGKWQPETLKEWTTFLSEQRLILNQVYDVLSPEVYASSFAE
ncbi:hypothetical protein E4U44_008239 [Claviceps purpurea]|nr:hypothetical protein E4U44_008239 [Claviceps purpurea]